jgi:hypothetical protein
MKVNAISLIDSQNKYDEICSYGGITLVRYRVCGSVRHEIHKDGKLIQRFKLGTKYFNKFKEMLLSGRMNDLCLECLDLANSLSKFYVLQSDLLNLVNGKLEISDKTRDYLKQRCSFMCFAKALGIPNIIVLNMARSYNYRREASEINDFVISDLKLADNTINVEGRFAIDKRFKISIGCFRGWGTNRFILYRSVAVEDNSNVEYVSMQALKKWGALAFLGWLNNIEVAVKLFMIIKELTRLVENARQEEMPSDIKSKWKWILRSEAGEKGLNEFANVIRNWKNE